MTMTIKHSATLTGNPFTLDELRDFLAQLEGQAPKSARISIEVSRDQRDSYQQMTVTW